MDEERLKQAARHAAEILAQAKVTAARASQALDRGREAGSVAAEALSRARRAEVWAQAAIGRSREVDLRPPGARQRPIPPAPRGLAKPPAARHGDGQAWGADALAWLPAATHLHTGANGHNHGGNGHDASQRRDIGQPGGSPPADGPVVSGTSGTDRG